MSSMVTLIQFAAELTLFLVALAGAALSLRHGLLGLDRPARLLLGGGFVTLAGIAFAVGSLSVERAAEPGALAGVRIAGAALVALGALRWAGSRIGRPTLLVGLGGLATAAALEARGIDVGVASVGAEPIVGMAAVVMGAALVMAGRHTIPGRIGTSAAGVLLAVILLVSIALSAVIAATVEDEARRRDGARAAADARAATAEAEDALDQANLVAGSIAAGSGPELELLAAEDRSEEQATVARAQLDGALAAVVGAEGLALEDPVLIVSPSAVTEVAVPSSLAGSTRLALAGDAVVAESLDADGPRQGVSVVGTRAFALAAVPLRVTQSGARSTRGAVVVARPLDATFLQRRADAGDPVSSALVTAEGVVATSGDALPDARLRRWGRQAITTGEPDHRIEAGRLVVARPVSASGLPPELALVLATPTERVGRTRADVDRSLFLVTLAAGLAGLALATVMGERIGGGIRQLTGAAAKIRSGDLDARAALDREDELGELSTTFDSMAASVRGLTGDLRQAARTEGELRARLETVFAGVTEAVVATDQEHRVTHLNRAAEALLEIDASMAIGLRVDEVVDLRRPDGGSRALRSDGGRPRSVVGSVHLWSGGQVPVEGTVASLHEGGAEAGTVVVLRDVRRERALEAAKQDFLANIGHELRTPLTPIKGYAGIMRRRAPSPDQAREWADGITAGVDRLEHLVERLVAFAAMTADVERDPVALAPVALRPLVTEVAARWRLRMGPGRSLEVATGEEVAIVHGDAAHLRLALGELIDNAARFSTPGTPILVEVGIEDGGLVTRGAVDGVPLDPAPGGPATASGAAALSDAPAASSAVAVRVHDAGGSEAPRWGDVGDAFAQGDPSPTRARDGLGLGLALVDRIARAHGGRLRVESSSQRGTTVSILLPVATLSANTPAAGSRDTRPGEGAHQ